MLIRTLSIAVAFVAVLSGVSMAAELAPGAKAPELKGLVGVDGKQYGSAELKDAKAVVVCFTCNSCPVAAGYEDRFNEFAKQYKDKGVEFIAINSNVATEDLAAMKQRAEEKDFSFPYVFDKSATAAADFGAKVTPHLFVLDGKGTVQYVGAFDDKQNNPTKHYVVDAVDAVLAGKTPATQQTRPVGCGIRSR